MYYSVLQLKEILIIKEINIAPLTRFTVEIKIREVSLGIFINKNIAYDNSELIVMLALNYLQSDKHDILYVDIKQIGYVITNRFISSDTDRVLYNNIKSGMTKLIERELIKIAGQSGNSYAILWKESKIKVDKNKDKFVVIELWELQKIFQSKINQPINLVHFFVDIVSTINNKTKEWHMSQDSMVESFGGSKSTINDYFKQLEKLELLYVYRPNKRRTDGTFRNINNSYGRYKDKDLIISSAHDYISQVECEDIDLTIDRRSIKLRYNAFVGGSKKYKEAPKLVEELYKDCVRYNKSLAKNPIYDSNFDVKSELDLSEFGKYHNDVGTNPVVTDTAVIDPITHTLKVRGMLKMMLFPK